MRWLIVLLLCACGSKTSLPVGVRADGDVSTSDTPSFDSGVPEPLHDTWWFNSVRALCDTFAFTVCEDGSARARFSYDDRCLAESPSSDAPYFASIDLVDDNTFVLDIAAPPGSGDPRGVVLRFDEAADHLEIVEWLSSEASGIWIQPGIRDAVVPMAPDDFVYCD